jgi:hypothetical protein
MGSVTIGATDYDIYGTEAGADAYMAAKIGATAWAAAVTLTKQQALVTATRMIERYLASKGQTVDPSGAVDEEIENANYELANALVIDSALQDNATQSNNTRRLKAGSAEVEYFRPVDAGRMPFQVNELLNGWLAVNGGGTYSGVGAAYGTCNESTLGDTDYEVNEGIN